MSDTVVGLTGGIGSGKTTVANLFAARGIAVVDTDLIAHQLTAPGGAAMPDIVQAFGPGVARADGALDRAAMREIVFSDPAARVRLESILHPMIARLAMAECAAATSPYVIVAVPLLVETGHWRQRCDRVLVVDCDEAVQIRRVMARNGLSEDAVRAILAAQADRQTRLAAADDVVVNNGDLAHLAEEVDALHAGYLKLADTKKAKANR